MAISIAAIPAIPALAAHGAVVASEAAPQRHHRLRAMVGVASVYARRLEGKQTASGELHDGDELVAAHRTLPLGSEVRVTNLSNSRSVVVRINDRGPAVKSRIIDLSPRAAESIGLRARGKGVTRVRLDVLREGEPDALTAGTPRSGGAAKDLAAAASSSAAAQ